MSATTGPTLDLQEQIARIARTQVEVDKFAAETRKLLAETAKLDRQSEDGKFAAETRKLLAETGKLDRDRAFLPWQIAAALMGGGAALFGAGIAFWKVLGY